jgi:4-alpha-glucanotransferase
MRDASALARASASLASEVAFAKFEQYLFERQFQALRAECHARGIALIGDIPIFVAHDSADVWQHRELFRVKDDGTPEVVAGVPPDYFSATGQLWGNPLYRWKRMKEDGYRFWVARFRKMLARFDAIRLDHFIGFQRYWEIPAGAKTAEGGRWVKGPGEDFFRTVREALGDLPLIAEDLGAVTPQVTRLRKRFRLPGIRILQFAFGTDPQAPTFLPHHYPRRAVVYTGTHDNDTTLGWFFDPGGIGTPRSPSQTEVERRAALRYLGGDLHEVDPTQVHWAFIRVLLMSAANTTIFPVQDLLGLGSAARMNRPGEPSGNWEWRLADDDLTPQVATRLGRLTRTYDRVPKSGPNAYASVPPPAMPTTATMPPTPFARTRA